MPADNDDMPGEEGQWQTARKVSDNDDRARAKQSFNALVSTPAWVEIWPV